MKVSNRILAARMSRRFNQQGLTLIELLVVLVILIALAGILIPQLPNMLTRSHTAAASTNIPEANKRIQEFEQIYFKQPANLDNLASGAALVDYLPGGTAQPGLAVTALTADSAGALASAGITSLAGLYDTKANLTTGGGSTTFSPYDVTNNIANVAASTANVAGVTESVVETLIRPDGTTADGDVYVAFGIGQKSELTGRVMNEAPYHFGDEAGSGPDTVYARYIAVYKVLNKGNAMEKALFIGVLGIHSDELSSGSEHVSEFFEANQL